MFVHCLGVAAGGGYPQWNCACAGCRKARAKPEVATTHAGIAVSGNGEQWFLLNATPDVHHQIAADPSLHPGPAIRETPVAGVLLTDVARDRFPTGFKAPRYVGRSPLRDSAEWEMGFRLEVRVTGGTVVYAPTLPRWDAKFAEQVATADCVFVDGTFWTGDEMSCQGAGSRTWRSRGHLPVGGADGSARALAALPAKRKIYTHINNTNPILDEESQERRRLTDSGIEVGRAGLEVEV